MGDEKGNTDETYTVPAKRVKLSSNLRKFKKIPIFIVEYHNEVLEFLYKCFASKHLPLIGNTLLHFDSHPDMVISKEIKASTVYNKYELLSQLSIENWIMPACYAGHFEKIIWVKNSWCDQMPIGEYTITIGEKDDIIYVDFPIDYFLSEGNYCNQNHLRNSRNITLQVNNIENYVSKKIIQFSEDNLILDIDLDFFSTTNPFLNIYKKSDCYNKLKEIFSYDTSDSYEKTSENRKIQLNYLNDVFDYLEKNGNLEKYKNTSIPNNIFENILKFVENICKYYDDIDWNLIKDAGFTCDNNGLPHHISTDDELKSYFNDFEKFLQKLEKPPVVVTISRSSKDEYCPINQVDFIQKEVLEILKKVFKDKISDNPILAYEDENWDTYTM